MYMGSQSSWTVPCMFVPGQAGVCERIRLRPQGPRHGAASFLIKRGSQPRNLYPYLYLYYCYQQNLAFMCLNHGSLAIVIGYL